MYKYKHIETGLYLKKVKIGYSQYYDLSHAGTVWTKKCLKTLSLKKEPFIHGFNQVFKPEEFEVERFKLVKDDNK